VFKEGKKLRRGKERVYTRSFTLSWGELENKKKRTIQWLY